MLIFVSVLYHLPNTAYKVFVFGVFLVHIRTEYGDLLSKFPVNLGI